MNGELWRPDVEDVIQVHDIEEEYKVDREGMPRKEKGVKEIQNILVKARKQDNLEKEAAYYLRELIKIHVFYDGNKRTAYLTTLEFLNRNNTGFQPQNKQKPEEIYNTMKWDIKFADIETIAHWIKEGELPDES